MSKLGSDENPLRIAIVGSGPSGFYSAEALIRSDLSVKIDLFDRLPNPYGLVRSGVAPDHPKLKQAIKVFDKIASAPELNFIGNVGIGEVLSVDELSRHYHGIIFCCGAGTDRRLGIPGEDLEGSYTATEFVAWYNGHPDYRNHQFDLSHKNAIIIGQGNVAADVGRILAKTVDELKNTDISSHALEVLAESKIKNIYIVGRRGPAQAKFTSKELKEFGELAICDPLVVSEELNINPESETELADKTNAGSKKVYELLKGYSELMTHDKPRQCHFTFLKSPVEILGEGKLNKIVFEKNQLSGSPFEQAARGTGETFSLDTGIVFRSIGYRGIAMLGVPFDEKRGLFPNIDGRITDKYNKPIPQFYTAGWIKRGPTGIIGTNRADGVATVVALLQDVESLDTGDEKNGAEGIYSLLNDRKIRHVSFSDWEKIDQHEVEIGRQKDKPREKITSVKEMLAILD